MKYLLDTNIVSYSINRQSPFHKSVIERLSKIDQADEVCISVLTLYEAEYGVLRAKSDLRERVIEARDLMKRLFSILPVNEQGAGIFGRLKHEHRERTGMNQKASGQHNIDFILAATALADNATIVSNDGIFLALQETEPKLKVENWTI